MQIKDPAVRDAVRAVIRQLDGLRRLFVDRLREGSIKHCGCGDPDCPTLMIPDRVARELDMARRKVLDAFRAVHQPFHVHLD